MKITIVFDAFNIGGAEKIGCNYAKEFLSMGHEVNMINLTPSQNNMKKEIPLGATYKAILYSQYFSRYYYFILLKTYAFGPILLGLIFPILFVTNKIYSFFLRIFQKPSDLVIAFAGHINDMTFVADNCIRAKKKICWFHGAICQKFLYSSAYARLCPKMDKIVVLNNEWDEQVFTSNHFMKKMDIVKIYNPIYFDERKIDEKNVDNYKKKYGKFIVMSARLAYPHKDHYTVIRSLNELIKKYKNSINLVLLGDGPEKNKIEDFAKSLNLDSNIFFVGSVSNVYDYYRASYLLVHASVAGEGLPTVILEAMACGIPVVATDSTVGPKEIIGNNEYGLLCPVFGYQEMAAHINRLLKDDTYYSQYSNKGKQRSEDFTSAQNETKIKALLSSIGGDLNGDKKESID